jgi:hypothetical protein
MWWYNTKEKYQGEVVQYQGEVVQYQGDLSSTVQSHAQFALAPVVMIQSCFFFFISPIHWDGPNFFSFVVLRKVWDFSFRTLTIVPFLERNKT